MATSGSLNIIAQGEVHTMFEKRLNEKFITNCKKSKSDSNPLTFGRANMLAVSLNA